MSQSQKGMTPTCAWVRTLFAVFRDFRGNAIVEAALVMPLCLSMIFGTIEVGRAMFIQNALQQAVEDAARCAAINTTVCGTEANIKTYAVNHVYGYSISSTVFTVTSPACGKKVAASFSFATWLAVNVGISGLSFNPVITAKSCHPV